MTPLFHRHPRLPGNDYRTGAYFVTLCTKPRREWFGRIVGAGAGEAMDPNALGRIVLDKWNAIPDHFPHVRLDQTQLMPDHLHAIVVLDGAMLGGGQLDDDGRSTHTERSRSGVDATVGGATVPARPRGPVRGSLGAIIGAFKSETTIRINELNGTPGLRYWQRGYHERWIRRTGGEFGRIAQYIADNPSNWR